MSDDQFSSPNSPASVDNAKNTSAAAPKKENWERDVLEKLAMASLIETRMRRRWNIFFRLLGFGTVFLLIWLLLIKPTTEIEYSSRHTALVEVDGSIETGSPGAANAVVPALARAFADSGSVGVILHINSPGGSPVQAGIINDEMARLRAEYPDKPLYVVVDEMCASGGYYIAAGADKIFVNKASIIGSIGVLMDGFGFTGFMDKVGVERRLMTAGENKGFMDPFSPQTAKQKEFAQGMLNEIHQQFIEVVRTGRGKRLKEKPETFSGLFWTGARAVEMGLADGFGTVDSVARDELKAEDVIDYTTHEGLSERVLKKFGASIGSSAVKAMTGENRLQLR